MDSLHKLEEIFAHFPGIGPRQAKRFVHYIQGKSSGSIKELVELIGEVRRSTNECNLCHRFFTKTVVADKTCPICSDPSRDQTTLMIVARDSDFETVEKSGAYKGLYFILGGTVPILDKEPEKKIRLRELLGRISPTKEKVTNNVVTFAFNEIILSLNTTPDGEHTAEIIKDALQKFSTKTTVLGRGLSTGAELEYADGETIRNALKSRL